MPDQGAPLQITGHALFRWARKQGIVPDIIAWGARENIPGPVVSWTPQQVSDAYAFGRTLPGQVRGRDEATRDPDPSPFLPFARDLILGEGGFREYEAVEPGALHDNPQVAVALWTLQCLAFPGCPDSEEILALIVRTRLEARRPGREGR